jgi:hypothetical protein
MQNVDNAAIPIWMRIPPSILVKEDHDVRTCSGIDCILITAHVVRRVIESNCLVEMEPIVDKIKSPTFSGCEFSLVACPFIASETAK